MSKAAYNLNEANELRQFENLELLARQVVEGFITGLHKSPFHGFSVEFAEHRLYNAGESTRHIDWKLYGRSDKLFVKRYEEETNLRCQLVIDASSSMYYPETGERKIDFAVKAAASLIYLLKRQRDAFGLSVFSDTVSLHTPCKSTTLHQKRLYTELQQLLTAKPEKAGSSIAPALHAIAEQTHQRSMVIIFSDMLDSYSSEAVFDALQHLRHNKHEVILFQVLDTEKEEQFQFDNRPSIFIDSETGEEVKLYPEQVKAHYLNQINSFREALTLKAYQYKVNIQEASLQKGFHQIISTFLTQRQRYF